MKILNHLITATLINGTIAVLIWYAYAGFKYELVWYSDTPMVWIVGTVIVGLFITVVCLPIFTYLTKEKSLLTQIVVGAIAGVTSVLLFFIIATHYPVNYEYMIARVWLYYLIFVVVGGLYGFMYYRRFCFVTL